jgi:hypothetical protein
MQRRVYHIPVGHRRDGNGEVIPFSNEDELPPAMDRWNEMIKARQTSEPYVIIGPNVCLHFDPASIFVIEQPTPEGAWQPSALSDWGL